MTEVVYRIHAPGHEHHLREVRMLKHPPVHSIVKFKEVNFKVADVAGGHLLVLAENA